MANTGTGEQIIALATMQRVIAGLGLRVFYPDHVWTGYAKDAEQLAAWKSGAERRGLKYETIGTEAA